MQVNDFKELIHLLKSFLKDTNTLLKSILSLAICTDDQRWDYQLHFGLIFFGGIMSSHGLVYYLTFK
jgi:hypothetical protein